LLTISFVHNNIKSDRRVGIYFLWNLYTHLDDDEDDSKKNNFNILAHYNILYCWILVNNNCGGSECTRLWPPHTYITRLSTATDGRLTAVNNILCCIRWYHAVLFCNNNNNSRSSNKNNNNNNNSCTDDNNIL